MTDRLGGLSVEVFNSFSCPIASSVERATRVSTSELSACLPVLTASRVSTSELLVSPYIVSVHRVRA